MRKARLGFCSEYMKAEDLQISYIDIGSGRDRAAVRGSQHQSTGKTAVTQWIIFVHIMRKTTYQSLLNNINFK
jgi:hypothetical protein